MIPFPGSWRLWGTRTHTHTRNWCETELLSHEAECKIVIPSSQQIRIGGVDMPSLESHSLSRRLQAPVKVCVSLSIGVESCPSCFSWGWRIKSAFWIGGGGKRRKLICRDPAARRSAAGFDFLWCCPRHVGATSGLATGCGASWRGAIPARRWCLVWMIDDPIREVFWVTRRTPNHRDFNWTRKGDGFLFDICCAYRFCGGKSILAPV